MNFRTTLILLALLAGTAVAYWLTRDTDTAAMPRGDENLAVELLLAQSEFRFERINHFTLERPGKPTIDLAKTAGQWHMTTPGRFNINISKFDQLLTALRSIEVVERQSTSPTSHEELATVTLHAGDDLLTLHFGSQIGNGLGRIHLNETDDTYIIKDDLHNLLTSLAPSAMLASRLSTPTDIVSRRIEIISDRGEVTLHRINSKWYLDEQGRERALSEPLDDYIDVAGYLNIPNASDIVKFESLPAGDLASYGFSHPRLVVRYTYVDTDFTTKTSVLTIASPYDSSGKNYYATYTMQDDPQPVVFVLPAEFSIVMARIADEFRDPRLIETHPAKIASLRIEPAGAAPVELSFTSDQAEATGLPEGAQLNQARANELINALATGRAMAYEPLPLDQGEVLSTVTVSPHIGSHSERFEVLTDHLFTRRQSTVLIRRANEPVVMRVPSKWVSACIDPAILTQETSE